MKLLGSTVLCAALVMLCNDATAESAEVRPPEVSAEPASPGPASKNATTAKKHAAARRALLSVDGMALRSDEVHRRLRDARTRRQQSLARCLDAKLSMAHAVERMARLELRLLKAKAAQGLPIASHLTRLSSFVERSQQIARQARYCGKTISRRAPMPTGYRVTMTAPDLPPPASVRRPRLRWRPIPPRVQR